MNPDDVLAEWERLAQEAREPLPDDARMDAYYYGFNHTGVGPVDAVLSAVAVAGRGAHHTETWSDSGDAYGYYENRPGLAPNRGGGAQDLIQRTAQGSAARVSAATTALTNATAALRAVLDLHRTTVAGTCQVCWTTTWGEQGLNLYSRPTPLLAPCPTVRAVTEALGGQG